MKQALISVSDKEGVVDLARELLDLGFNLLSTGGTAKLLSGSGLRVMEVSQYTEFPEMLDGRVKTLHPKVHGGILARRDLAGHMRAIEEAGIGTIDLVVVNLYPFARTIARPNCTLDEAIENIDIGGPTMVRAAAKNYAHVAIVTDPADYNPVLQELRTTGTISTETRFRLARKAFSHTAVYDGAIGNYLTAIDASGRSVAFPDQINFSHVKVQDLRYGENPHQAAAFYRDVEPVQGSLSSYRQLQGKELSFNNLADSDAAWECVKTFEQTACVIIKHANPCGVAIADTTEAAYQRAFSTDPTSAFGGIIAFNREVGEACAQALTQQFVEVLIAPKFTSEAKRVLSAKTNVRVLEIALHTEANRWDTKRVGGGVLVQTPDSKNVTSQELKVVTRAQPSTAQMNDLMFAWRVAKFVKSNAIVFCRNGQTLGVGAGQMSRVDSARIAAIKADNAGLILANSVVASDAFFPFRDGLDVVIKAGAQAIIQPGGSMRDEEVIAAANEHGVAMVLTGVRHFRH
jgi:phosphoribosylaminoimidazolecarboxamide formyltransferase/IMP cyclohydrolase